MVNSALFRRNTHKRSKCTCCPPARPRSTETPPPAALLCRKDVLGIEAKDSVTASFFGDGTCNVGQFYESLNMAALYKLPHIFVVENNKWAIGMNHPRSTARTLGDEDPMIYKKGAAFGMPGVHVDGMDVLKVREGARHAQQGSVDAIA